MGQEIGEGEVEHSAAAGRRAIYGERAPGHLLGFVHHLPAAAAGRDERFVLAVHRAADDGDGGDIGEAALRVDGGECDRFGAERQAIARIFEIAAGDDAAIGQPHRRTDRKAAIGRMGMGQRAAGCRDQRGDILVFCTHGATTSHLMYSGQD